MFGTFGNKVRINNSPGTEEKGLAGKLGEILGETAPSMMELQVIGSPKVNMPSMYILKIKIDHFGLTQNFLNMLMMVREQK